MSTGIDQVREVTRKWLFLEDPYLEDTVLATVLANRLQGDPLWILFVGPPSSAKTEILRALEGQPDIRVLSTLTPQTLISGYIGQPPQKSSLIFRLSGKTLVLKDFTTVIQMRSEARQEILSQLREVYDGRYSKAFGTGEEVSWEGKVGLLAGVTPVIEKCYGVNSVLGERFLLYRITPADPHNVAKHVLYNRTNVGAMRDDIKSAMQGFLGQFAKTDLSHFELTPELKEVLGSIAIFIAQGRTTVERDRGSQAISMQPMPEGPARITAQLSLLFSGLMVAYRWNPSMVNRAMDVVRKVGLDNIPSLRRSIIEGLFMNSYGGTPDQGIALNELSDLVSLPHMTVRYVLHELNAVGFAGIRRAKGKEMYHLTHFCAELIRTAGLMDGDLQTMSKGRD